MHVRNIRNAELDKWMKAKYDVRAKYTPAVQALQKSRENGPKSKNIQGAQTLYTHTGEKLH